MVGEKKGEAAGDGGQIEIFVSHKASDRAAALNIKRILENESPRIDVHVYESTPAGSEWEKWIFEKLQCSQILLLLYTDPSKEWDWCLYETGLFTPLDGGSDRVRRVVCLYNERKPEPLRALEAIYVGSRSTELSEKFLAPLFKQTEAYVGVGPALNDRKTDDSLAEMAARLTEALELNTFKADYVVTTLRVDLPEGLDDAALPAETPLLSMSGPLHLFGQIGDAMTWGRLVQLAEADQMKGTAWQKELERGILAAARGDIPETMTATFRGKDSGRIFSSLIYRVDRRNGVPARVYVAFLPVIVPELVRAPGVIGDVYVLVRLANRFRYEVLHPYLKRLHAGTVVDIVTERRRIVESIATIVDEAERHDMMEITKVALLFPDSSDQEALYRMNAEWAEQFQALDALPDTPEESALVEILGRMECMNTAFLKMASQRYARLVSEQPDDTFAAARAENSAPDSPVPRRALVPVPEAMASTGAGGASPGGRRYDRDQSLQPPHG